MILDFYENSFDIEFQDFFNVFFGKLFVAFYYHFGTFHRNDFTGIFVDEVLSPCVDHTGCELLADNLFKVRFGDFNLFGQGENVQNVFVRFETHSTEEGCDGEFLFTVDVGVHHVVDVCSEFHPRAFERNDTC